MQMRVAQVNAQMFARNRRKHGRLHASPTPVKDRVVPDRYLGRQIGKYRVIRLLGGGAFAWVYEAIDQDLEIPVALKVLRPEFAGDSIVEARFRREASTAARLRHRNIVIVRDVGQSDGASFVAMDLLEGSLGQRLRASASLPERDVVRVGMDVAAALGTAHVAGVIHRDIKPDNILFGPAAEAVVADFGLARALSGDAGLSATNQVMGTPHYFSPEQARGLTLDGRSDLYSLGVTLYRAATGKLPFEGDDWYAVGRQHIESAVPRPRDREPSLSEPFEQLLLRLLAKQPDDRYPDADALLAAFALLPSAPTERVPIITPSGTSIAHQTAGPFPALAAASMVTRAVAPVSVFGSGAWRAVGVAALVVIVAGTLFRVARSDSSWLPRFSGRSVDLRAHVRDSLVSDSAAREVMRDSLLDIAHDSARPPRSVPPNPVRGTIAARPVGLANDRAHLDVHTAIDAELFVDGASVGVGAWSGERPVNRDIKLRAVIDNAPAGCNSAQRDTVVRTKAGGHSTISLRVVNCRLLRLDVLPGDASLQFTPKDGGSAVRVRADSAGNVLLPVGRYEVIANFPRCIEYRDSLNLASAATGDSLLRVRLACGLGSSDSKHPR